MQTCDWTSGGPVHVVAPVCTSPAAVKKVVQALYSGKIHLGDDAEEILLLASAMQVSLGRQVLHISLSMARHAHEECLSSAWPLHVSSNPIHHPMRVNQNIHVHIHTCKVYVYTVYMHTIYLIASLHHLLLSRSHIRASINDDVVVLDTALHQHQFLFRECLHC